MAQKSSETIEYKEFVKAVSSDNLDRLYIFHGEEHYMMEHYLVRLRSLLVPDGLEEFNHRRFDGKGLTVATISDAVDIFPVFSERSFVEIHDYDIFKAPESERSALISLFSDLPEYICIVFVYSTLEFKPDKRLKDSKEILKLAHDIEFKLQDGEKIVRWICQHAKNGGKQISRQNADYLSFITGSLMTTLNTEIDKLCSYCNSDEITRADIDACVTPIADAVVYKMANAISEGNYEQAAGILSELMRMREPGHKIIYSVTMTMRQLLSARLCLERGKDHKYLMDHFGVRFEFQAKNLIKAARKASLSYCRNAVILCADTAFSMNSGANPEEALIELVANIGLGKKAVYI